MTTPIHITHAVTKPVSGYDSVTHRVPPSANRVARSEVPQRSLHLIDIENLLGDPFCQDLDLIRTTFETYARITNWQPEDQVLIAANRWLYSHLLFPLRSWKCRLFTASGPNGADLRLLREAEQETLVRQFDRLVIGSGDGIFSSVLHLAKSLDVQSLVACRTGAMSQRLKRASDTAVTWKVDAKRCGATATKFERSASWRLPNQSDIELGQDQQSSEAHAA
jgi:uncharacterized LabA/DUF88 family protein